MEDSVKAHAMIGNRPYATELTAAGFSLTADEPTEKGGSNLGPTPDMLLCMSLASCTAITLRMYAGRKQWDIGELHVDVALYTKEDGTRYFGRIIQCEKPLDQSMHERLLNVANKCPVHKVLSAANTIDTKWPAE